MPQWVAIDAALELNHKVARFRASLGWSNNDLVARLYRMWAWVRRDRPDGVLSHSDVQALPAVMDSQKISGDVVTALLECGLVEPEGNGRFVVHDWMQRNGHYVREAARKRRYRASVRVASADVDGRAIRAGAGAGAVAVERTSQPKGPPPNERDADAPSRALPSRRGRS